MKEHWAAEIVAGRLDAIVLEDVMSENDSAAHSTRVAGGRGEPNWLAFESDHALYGEVQEHLEGGALKRKGGATCTRKVHESVLAMRELASSLQAMATAVGAAVSPQPVQRAGCRVRAASPAAPGPGAERAAVPNGRCTVVTSGSSGPKRTVRVARPASVADVQHAVASKMGLSIKGLTRKRTCTAGTCAPWKPRMARRIWHPLMEVLWSQGLTVEITAVLGD